MSEIQKFDVVREMNEFRNQISIIKRIGFFFGAGTSMSLGLSGIQRLTRKVEANLDRELREDFIKVKESLGSYFEDPAWVTIEDILNQLRLIRQITRDGEDRYYERISGKRAKLLDITICNKIYEIISDEERGIDYTYTKKFFSWLNWLCRDYTKEIFTTNYDLVFEKAMESLQIPYFDGFVGANEPFFLPESIECKIPLEYPPLSWIRLWKIHGSFGWFWRKTALGNSHKVVRLGVLAKCSMEDNDELVIYPSKEKYELSRKQPFIAYFDRLKRSLLEGEGIFVISGYSFSDDHINEIFFNSLKQNNRLHLIAFLYSDNDMAKIRQCDISYMNFTAYSPNEAIVGGKYGKWTIDSEILKDEKTKVDSFWDKVDMQFKLGDFKNMVNFLTEICGKQDRIEKEIEDSK